MGVKSKTGHVSIFSHRNSENPIQANLTTDTIILITKLNIHPCLDVSDRLR